jgi:arylsulfatase A-like enzyme
VGNSSPNILVIVTDDQRLAGTMEVMPKTVGWFQTGDVPERAPVTGGTAYPNAVCTTPLCAPSRSSILTGRYAHNHGVWKNDGHVEPDPAHVIQTYVRESPAGYRTGVFGKYLNNWTRNHPAPEGPPGFDRWSIFDGGQYFPLTVNEQGVQRTVLEYSTEYFAGQAVSFLDQAAEDDKPWFLYVAPATPHSPFTPDPRYANSPVPEFRAPPSYFELDRRDKPAWVRWNFSDPEWVQSTRTAQLRMLRSADDLVDRIMARLGDLGEDSNTLAFFTADHGWHWGEYGLASKASPYIESIRVPFYVRWPGHVQSNEADPSLVANIDIAPTVLEAAGARLGAGDPPIDGRSLLGGSPARNRILTEYDLFRSATSPAAGRQHRKWASLLTPTFHYIETYEPGTENKVWHEYYDLVEDPHEITNLLDGPERELPPPIAKLSAQLAADRACQGPSCPPSPGDPPTIEVEIAPAVIPADTGAATSAPGQTRIRAPAVTRLPGTSVFFALGRADEPPPPATRMAGFECSLDGEPFRRCGRRVTVSGLANGAHSFRAVSIDAAGNRDLTPATYEWTAEAVPSFSDTPDPGWPEITGAPAGESLEARAVVADGEGGWYVGGNFTSVGEAERVRLVHINPDKTVDRSWSPSANGIVKEMALSEDRGTLYIGGVFTAVDGQARGRLAALDATSGALTSWNPSLDGHVNGLALAPGSVYVVGAFTTAGGRPRSKVAEISLRDARATDWDPGANPGAILLAIELAPEHVYVGGAGLTSIAGAPRRNLARLDRASGQATAWDPSPDGEVEALRIAPDAETIFVGGRFKEIGVQAARHSHAAEVMLTDEGTATGWRPMPSYMPPGGRLPTVLDFSITDLTPPGGERRWSIVIAGAFDTVKARYTRNLIAEVGRFDDLNGDGNPADWDPKLDSNAALDQPPAVPCVFAATESGPLIAVAGNFYASGSTPRRALAFYGKPG